MLVNHLVKKHSVFNLGGAGLNNITTEDMYNVLLFAGALIVIIDYFRRTRKESKDESSEEARRASNISIVLSSIEDIKGEIKDMKGTMEKHFDTYNNSYRDVTRLITELDQRYKSQQKQIDELRKEISTLRDKHLT